MSTVITFSIETVCTSALLVISGMNELSEMRRGVYCSVRVDSTMEPSSLFRLIYILSCGIYR